MGDCTKEIAYIWLDGKGDLSLPFAIRIRVFCDEQGYTPEMEIDQQDQHAWHVLLTYSEKPIATGRIFWKEPEVMMLGRIAVERNWRGKGIGRLIVEEMSRKAAELGAHKLQLDAQCRAAGFYEKLGFSICGEEHMDGHVPHVLMEKKQNLLAYEGKNI